MRNINGRCRFIGLMFLLGLSYQANAKASVYIAKDDTPASPLAKTKMIPQPGIMHAVVLNNNVKPAFISKQQVKHFLQDKHYQLQLSADIARITNPDNLSDAYFFYQNPSTQTVGVAKTPKAARFLTHALVEVFFTRSGETLSNTLTRWAKRAGYQLDWLSQYDFPIEYDYAFYGHLTDSNGPLDQLLQSIKDSNFSLRAEVTRNHVILIRDNDYQPASLNN